MGDERLFKDMRCKIVWRRDVARWCPKLYAAVAKKKLN